MLRPGAPLSLSAFNFNAVFRSWAFRGNAGAREGLHMLGGDYYYFRFTRREIRRELEVGRGSDQRYVRSATGSRDSITPVGLGVDEAAAEPEPTTGAMRPRILGG